jgi:replicative DNA helicase
MRRDLLGNNERSVLSREVAGERANPRLIRATVNGPNRTLIAILCITGIAGLSHTGFRCLSKNPVYLPPMNNLAKIAKSLGSDSADAAVDTTLVRNAPHNLEAEQALLGAILVNNEAMDRVTGFLEPVHFYDPLHGAIYETAGKLIGMGKQATPITLRTFFENSEPLGEITVPQYLGRLAASATTIINARDYGHTIYDLAIRRQLILIGEEMVNTAYDAAVDNPPKEQIEEAEQRLFQIAEKGKYGSGFGTFSAALTVALEMANNAYLRDGGLSGVATGLRDLDGKMGGLQSSDLIILAGRPSMGKTALATNIAFNIAKAYRAEKQTDGTVKVLDGAVVGFFSLEMSAEQLATRILSEQAEISSEDIRRGKIKEDDFRRLKSASAQLCTLPLFIDQTGGITMAQLAARARKLKRQHNVGLLIVDYLQLISGSGKRSSDSRVQEVTEITTGLKALAKELAVPIIALSQLSRQVETREDKRPQLSDLRESGSIEQDADVVMFVFREEYYVQRSEPAPNKVEEYAKWQSEMERTHGTAEVIIGKQRHGPTGTVRLQFQGQFTRFSDLAAGSQAFLERDE